MSFLTRLEINNFRIFDEPTGFELSPITILVGANSSGKSTMIRALKILTESATNEGLFYLLKRESETDYLMINDLFPTSLKSNTPECISFKLDIIKDPEDKSPLPLSFHVKMEYISNSDNRIGTLYSIQIFDSKSGKNIIDSIDGKFTSGLKDFFEILLIGDDLDNKTQEKIRNDLAIVKCLADLFADKIIYLPASRNMPQREFRRKDESFLARKLFAIEDDDLKIFNAYNNDQKDGGITFNYWPSNMGKQFVFTNNILKSLFSIGDYMLFRPNEHLGNYELLLHKNDKEVVNLADLGYGVSNLITLLLSVDIAASDYKGTHFVKTFNNTTLVTQQRKYSQKIILCEEPELSLHPNYQSKLADVFVSAYKDFGVSSIIETHSEYLIRKLQYLVARKEISSKEIAIYYFPEKAAALSPFKIEILADGRLSKPFGNGFYDEATNIMMSILTGENIN